MGREQHESTPFEERRRTMNMNALSATCGDLWRLVRPRQAAVLAALLLALCPPGWTAAAGQAQSAERVTVPPVWSRGQGHGRPVEWLKLQVFTDAPVVGADVRVSVHGSQGRPLVEVQAATNNQGVVPVALPSHPSFFRVSVSGGTTNGNPFLGHLSADVVLDDPAHQLVVVNPVTTLVSLVLDARPDLKLEGAEALVRQFLELPENYSLGMALRVSAGYRSRHFSPGILVAEAEAAGGLDAFLAVLLQELLGSPSAKHAFRSNLLGGTGTSLATSLAQGALSYAGGQGAGWVMQSAGIPTFGATTGSIAALQQALANLQSSVDDLSTKVDQLTQLVQSTATQTQYNTITTAAQPLAIKVSTVQDDLSFFAQWCPPLAEGSPQTTPDDFCITQEPIVKQELINSYENKDYELLEGYIQDNGTLGTSGMLHLYSLWLAESKPFWRAADSTKMQTLYDYWDTILTLAANLRMELFHELGYQDSLGGQALLTSFMGDTTNGTFWANQAANSQLMKRPLTSGFVFVSTTPVSTTSAGREYAMWSIYPWNELLKPAYPSTTCNQHGYSPLVEFVPQYVQLSEFAGFRDWQPNPTYPQWQALVKGGPTSTQGTLQNWLTTLTKADPPESPTSPGFFNEVGCHSPAFPVWSQTKYNSSAYWVIQLDKGSSNCFKASCSGPGCPDNFDWPARALASDEQYFWDQ
jgi:hypothetical protein